MKPKSYLSSISSLLLRNTIALLPVWVAAVIFASSFQPLQAQAPVDLVIQTGHYEQLTCLAFSPDSKYLASGAKDGKVLIWDLGVGKMYREIKAHTKAVTQLAWTPDGKWLISGGERKDTKLIVWDWQTGDTIWHGEDVMGNSVKAMKVSPDGKVLVAGSVRDIGAWDMQTGQELWQMHSHRKSHQDMEIRHEINDINFSKDGKKVIFNSREDFWMAETATGTILTKMKMEAGSYGPDAVEFGSGEKSIVCLDYKEGILEYDLESNEIVRQQPWQDRIGGSCLGKFSGDGANFVMSCGQYIYSLNRADGSLNFEKKVESIHWNRAFAVSPNGKLFAVGGEHVHEKTFRVVVFSMKNQAKIHELNGYPGRIVSLDLNKKGNLLATGSRERNPRVWDLGSARGYVNYEEEIIGKGDSKASVRLGPDDESLYYSEHKHSYRYDLATTQLQKETRQGCYNPGALLVDPDGKYVFLDEGFQVVDPKTFEQIAAFDRPFSVKSIVLSADKKTLYVGSHKRVLRFNTENWDVLSEYAIKGSAHGIAPSIDGKQVVVQSNGRLLLLNESTGEHLQKIVEVGEHPVYHPDGTILAHSAENEIYFRDANTFSVTKTLKGHVDEVNVLAFTQDGRFLVSGSEDTSVKIWDAKSGKLVATLLGLKQEDYIIITPDNYYMTSKGGVDGVVFRKGNKLFPFEQFDLHFNRPDIVLERLGYASQEVIDAYKRSYLKRLKKTGFNESDLKLDFHIPEMIVENKSELNVETDEHEVELKIKASDSKYTLDRLNVWINDVPVYGTQGIPLKGQGKKAGMNAAGNELNRDIPVQLLAGKNKIQVSVLNSNGVESLRETIELTYHAPDAKPNLYLLAIGASRYQQSTYNLTYAAKDALDLSATFEKASVFGEVKTRVLVDEQVTREQVLGSADFLKGAGINDVVMVFVAGHGLLDQNFDYYFATHEIDFDEPEKKGIEYSELESLLDGITALKKILIMDTCHSGEVDKDEVEEDKKEVMEEGAIVFRNVGVGIRKKDGLGGANTSELMKELFTDLRRGTGATVISSAGGAEYAMESAEWKNGLFTYCLLHSLDGGHSDLDDNGRIHLSELQQYVTSTVKKMSDGKQVPTCRMENLSLDYEVW